MSEYLRYIEPKKNAVIIEYINNEWVVYIECVDKLRQSELEAVAREIQRKWSVPK